MSQKPQPFTPLLVLFDMDGTLVDTMGIHADIVADLLSERHGIPKETARERFLTLSGLPFDQQMDIIVGNDPGKAETIRLVEERKIAESDGVALDEKTRHSLTELLDRGYLLAISSNNLQENVNAFVKRERLEGIFCRWLGWHAAGRMHRLLGLPRASTKGEMHFSDLERVLKVPRDRILFTGDSLKDAEIAERSGVDFVPKLGTFAQSDFESHFPGKHRHFVSHLSELNALLP